MNTLIFDTETTGLLKSTLTPIARQPKIIEFFGLGLEGLEEDGSVSFLFNPGEKLDKKITEITRLTDEDLKDAPKFDQMAGAIKELIENSDEIVAHNLSFDKMMVDIEMKRCGLTVRWPRLICTVECTEFLKGYRLSLSALHQELFGEAFEGAHRAEVDVRALARCFIELRKREIV